MAKKKIRNKSAIARPKPRYRTARRRGVEAGGAESTPTAEEGTEMALASQQLTRVNSALVRRRQKDLVNATAAPARKYGSASEFVREQPVDMPSRQVVEKAEKLGIKLSQSLVRVIRFHMRHAGEPRSIRAGGPARKTSAVAWSVTVPAAEAQFRKLAVELGTARAKALVAEVERAIEVLVTGR